MVKRVVWTTLAFNQKKDILHYWKIRNKSNVYCIKLDFLFKRAIQIISEYPKIGRLTDDKNLRVKIVRDYLIFYAEYDNEIVILSVWDNRQNPDKLKRIIGG